MKIDQQRLNLQAAHDDKEQKARCRSMTRNKIGQWVEEIFAATLFKLRHPVSGMSSLCPCHDIAPQFKVRKNIDQPEISHALTDVKHVLS